MCTWLCSGAACTVETRPAALFLRSARGTACKELWGWAVRDWADLLETASRVGRARLDPRDDDPTAVWDGTGRTNLFDISSCQLFYNMQ